MALPDQDGKVVKLLPIEHVEKKENTSMLSGLFSRLFFRRRLDIVKLLAGKNLETGQLVQVRNAIEKGLAKGGDLQVLKFAAGEQRQVEKLAKKYGILYSVLSDINKKDGMCEIIFHTEAVPRVNMMLQKLKSGKLATFDGYLNNGDKKEMDKVLSFLKKKKQKSDRLHTEEDARAGEHLLGLIEKAGMYASSKKDIIAEEIRKKFSISYGQAEEAVGKLEEIGVLSSADNGQHKVLMDQEDFTKRIRRYQELAGRIKAAAAKENNFVDITLSKKLATEENSHAVKVRLPGTWGEIQAIFCR
jgi:hypothetical protein